MTNLNDNTIVGTYDPELKWEKVRSTDIFLTPLGKIDFDEGKARILLTPESGWVSIAKTEDGYELANSNGASTAAEELLDRWDDFLLSRGYSYIGDDGEDGYNDNLIVYSKPQDKIIPVIVLYKDVIEKAVESEKLSGYVAAYFLRHDKYYEKYPKSLSDMREDFFYKNAKGALRKALEDAIDERKDDGENLNCIARGTYTGYSRDPETVLKDLYDDCNYRIRNK